MVTSCMALIEVNLPRETHLGKHSPGRLRLERVKRSTGGTLKVLSHKDTVWDFKERRCDGIKMKKSYLAQGQDLCKLEE